MELIKSIIQELFNSIAKVDILMFKTQPYDINTKPVRGGCQPGTRRDICFGPFNCQWKTSFGKVRIVYRGIQSRQSPVTSKPVCTKKKSTENPNECAGQRRLEELNLSTSMNKGQQRPYAWCLEELECTFDTGLYLVSPFGIFYNVPFVRPLRQ